MPEDRAVREIVWRELFPWLNVVRAVRLSLAPRLLSLAAIGLFLTALGWHAIGWVYSKSDDIQKLKDINGQTWIDLDCQWPWQSQVDQIPSIDDPQSFNPAESPLIHTGRWLSGPFRRLFLPIYMPLETAPASESAAASGTAPENPATTEPRIGPRFIGVVPFTYSLLCGLWAVAVWGLCGGAITRIAALMLTRESRASFSEGLRYAGRKWFAYFFAPLFPLVGVLILSLTVGLIFGLLMRADFGVMVMSILWPLMLGAALVMAILLLGLMFGWALMWPTVSVEGTDSFDALSRSYSYTFQRPFYYLFFVIVVGAIGLLSATVVYYLAGWTIQLGFWAASWGSGSDRMQQIQYLHDVLKSGAALPTDTSGTLAIGVQAIAFWNGCVMLLATAYLFSYFWTSATSIYLLLRQKVDGTEMDEIAVVQEEETYGLPPLANDATGVPQAADTHPPPPPPPPPPA